MTTQPEALRLAEALETPGVDFACSQVATELRQLHAANVYTSDLLTQATDDIRVMRAQVEALTKELQRLHSQNNDLASALAASRKVCAKLDTQVEALTAAARMAVEALENVAAAMPFPVADQAIRALNDALKGQA